MLKPDILRNKKDFTALYQKGRSVGGKFVVVFFRRNGLGYGRRAFLASKKVGNSVKRNRARRLMKEGYRALEGHIETGYDVLFIARGTIVDVKCADVTRSMQEVLKRARIWKP